MSEVFIDGTKIEANANKYTFVWRGSIEKGYEKLKEKASIYLKEELGIELESVCITASSLKKVFQKIRTPVKPDICLRPEYMNAVTAAAVPILGNATKGNTTREYRFLQSLMNTVGKVNEISRRRKGFCCGSIDRSRQKAYSGSRNRIWDLRGF